MAHHAEARDAPDPALAVGHARPLLGREGALDVGAVLVEQVVDRQRDFLVVAPVALEHEDVRRGCRQRARMVRTAGRWVTLTGTLWSPVRRRTVRLPLLTDLVTWRVATQ